MSIPTSKMYVISMNYEGRQISVAALSEDGEKFVESGNSSGDYLWSDWSEPMSPAELAERLEFALSVRES